MKKILIIFAFLFSGFVAAAQNHNLRYYHHQEDFYDFWVLEEKTNYRTFSNIVSPDGKKTYNHSRGYHDEDEMDKVRELVKEILLPILSRYESQGLFDLVISYIILPDGSIDEVSFQFDISDGKLDITEEEMVVWQKLSDALKQNIKIAISCDAPEVQFGRSVQGIMISKLLNPEPPTVQNSDTAKKKVYFRQLTPEEAEKRRKEREAAEIVMTLKD